MRKERYAVIDDVLGLVVLTVIEALVLHGLANVGDMAWIIGKAAGFLIVTTLATPPLLFWSLKSRRDDIERRSPE